MPGPVSATHELVVALRRAADADADDAALGRELRGVVEQLDHARGEASASPYAGQRAARQLLDAA